MDNDNSPYPKRMKLNNREYLHLMGFLTPDDIRVVINGYFKNRIKEDSSKGQKNYHNLATLTWCLERNEPLMYRDGEGWVPAPKLYVYESEDMAMKVHNASIIRLLHNCSMSPAWLARYVKSTESFSDLDSKIHSDFYKLSVVEDAIPETKSTIAPSEFKCIDCYRRMSMKREKRCVPVQLSRYISSKWHNDPDKVIGPICQSCYSDYVDENGDLLVSDVEQCGLCARDTKLSSLKKAEPSLLNLDPDSDLPLEHYSEDETQWLRTIEHRKHDFWCPVCITHTVGVIGADALVEMRKSLADEWFHSDDTGKRLL